MYEHDINELRSKLRQFRAVASFLSTRLDSGLAVRKSNLFVTTWSSLEMMAREISQFDPVRFFGHGEKEEVIRVQSHVKAKMQELEGLIAAQQAPVGVG